MADNSNLSISHTRFFENDDLSDTRKWQVRIVPNYLPIPTNHHETRLVVVNGLEGLLAIQQLTQDTLADHAPIENCNKKRQDFRSAEASWQVNTIRRVAHKGCAWEANQIWSLSIWSHEYLMRPLGSSSWARVAQSHSSSNSSQAGRESGGFWYWWLSHGTHSCFF